MTALNLINALVNSRKLVNTYHSHEGAQPETASFFGERERCLETVLTDGQSQRTPSDAGA